MSLAKSSSRAVLGLLVFFLVALVVASVGVAIRAGMDFHANNGGSKRDPTVVIIGGGMAGLSAARTLHQQGYDFTIIEASGRLGGRVKSVLFNDVTVEIGSPWIIGLDGNPIWRMAQEYNLTGIVADYDSYAVRASGGWDMTSDADNEYEKSFSGAVKSVADMGVVMRNKSQPDVSLRGSLREKGWLPKKAVQHAIEYYEYDFDFSAPPEQVSVRYNQGLKADKKEFYVLDDRGFDGVLRNYADEFLEERDMRLQLNELVTDIEHDATGCKVKTDSGKIFRVGYCILTVSLGVLQRGGIKFKPELPAWKRRAIQKHGMSSLVQIYVKFPTNIWPFWDPQQYILHASGRRGHFPLFVNMEAQGLLKEGSNILMMVVSGQEAERLEQLSGLDLKKEIANVLSDMYSREVPLPVDIYISRFSADPLFYGAHAHWPYGFVGDDMKAFKAGVGTLYFAGEATSEKYCGLLQGAYESGIDAAQEVIRCINGNCHQFRPHNTTCYS